MPRHAEPSAWQRHWPALMVLLLGLAAFAPLALPPHGAAATAPHAEWPPTWDGAPLRPLATTPVERRFAAQFPGAIGRFDDGTRVLVLRRIDAPTRMLHPAADCFRGLGHRIADQRLEHDGRGRLQRCMVTVSPDGERLRVCERIEAADGRGFVDASAWFWSATLGRSAGPWWAVTTVEAL